MGDKKHAWNNIPKTVVTIQQVPVDGYLRQLGKKPT